jgi:flagellar biosynthesis protein FlhA
MSKNSALPLSVLAALGAGALLALTASTQRDRLPVLNQAARPTLEPAQPPSWLEIALSAELACEGGRLRETSQQVPNAIRQSLGFAPTHVAFSEDIDLPPYTYAIRLRGLTVATGKLKPQALLALATGSRGTSDLAGEAAIDAASGRSGIWISIEDEGRARLYGYDVLEPGFVLALHLDTVLRKHLYEWLTREETYRLLERAKQTNPRTVADLQGRLEVGALQKVLQNLLREQVSLRDLALVLEHLADAATSIQTPEALTEAVRVGLSRQLSTALADSAQVIHALPLSDRALPLLKASPDDPKVAAFLEDLGGQLEAVRERGFKPVLLAGPETRADARRLIERTFAEVPVLSAKEIDPAFQLEILAAKLPEAAR